MATNARDFNGAGDVIETSLGGVTNFSTSTVACIAKLDAIAGGGIVLGGNVWILYTDSNQLRFWNGANAVNQVSGTITTGRWYLLGFTKTTGSTTGVFHIYDYTTTTWTHPNANTTLANSSGAASLNQVAPTDFNGQLQAAAFWTTNLSSANFETMAATRQSWLDLSPAAMWTLNQSSVATPLDDDVGAADQTSITGTTVVTGNPDWADSAASWPPAGSENSDRTIIALSGARLR